MRIRIPRIRAPLTYGILQSGVTTAVATTAATVQAAPPGWALISCWLSRWLAAWRAMVPIVIMAGPLIQKAALWLTQPEGPSADGLTRPSGSSPPPSRQP